MKTYDVSIFILWGREGGEGGRETHSISSFQLFHNIVFSYEVVTFIKNEVSYIFFLVYLKELFFGKSYIFLIMRACPCLAFPSPDGVQVLELGYHD